jgi:hypothetical protein
VYGLESLAWRKPEVVNTRRLTDSNPVRVGVASTVFTPPYFGSAVPNHL